MTIHYVDSNASGLNDGTSWANAFADLDTADTSGSVADNDTIYVASNHSKLYGATNKIVNFNVSNLQIISVNSSTGAYESGAMEGTVETDNAYYLMYGVPAGESISFAGMHFHVGSGFVGGFGTGTKTYYTDCTFKTYAATAGSCISTLGDGVVMHCKNCTFDMASFTSPSGSPILIGYGSIIFVDNCTFTASGSVANCIVSIGSGAGYCEIRNSDISVCSNAIAEPGGPTADALKARLFGCKIHASATLFSSAPITGAGGFVEGFGIDSGDGYYVYAFQGIEGEISTDVTTYLDATYDGSTGFSFLLESTAYCLKTNPLKVKLLEIPAQDLTASKDVTVEFVFDTDTGSGSTLTDQQFWIEAVHNDNTDEVLGVLVSTRPSDILAAGTEHTASTESWTSPPTNNAKYKETVTIPALANVDNGTIEIWCYLADASADVYVDPAVTIT